MLKLDLSNHNLTTIAGYRYHSSTLDGTGTGSTGARFDAPGSITTDGAYLYFSDTGNHVVRKINLATSAVTMVTGTYGTYGNLDGSASTALLDGPSGLVSLGGRLHVLDYYNNRICSIH